MIMDPLAEFARNFPLLPTVDDSKALEALLKQRLAAFAHEELKARQKALKSPEDLHYYIGRLDMQGTPAAYVIENGDSRYGFYKEPEGPYEIYENGKPNTQPKQIFSMLDYYSYCSDFLKSLTDDITVTEFVESKGKEEEEEEEEAPKKSKRKRSTTKPDKEPEVDKMDVEVAVEPVKKEDKEEEEEEEEKKEEEPPKKKTRKKRSTTTTTSKKNKSEK